MYKSTSIIILSIFLSINVFAQKMEKQLYSEDIVIVDETDKKLMRLKITKDVIWFRYLSASPKNRKLLKFIKINRLKPAITGPCIEYW